jgi:polyisoprenoid-binding protein YceI
VMIRALLVLTALSMFGTATAAPVTYRVDPDHTYPSFEADHMAGLSVWRGKFRATSGSVVLDKEAKTGSVDVSVDLSSIDFGHNKLNEHVKGPDMFDVAKYPTGKYSGKLTKFKNGAPTEVDGTLTMHGVTKPVKLTIRTFLCKMHPMLKKEVCGADAAGVLNRADFGVNYGAQYGFNMAVKLQIQVEGLRED